MWQRVCSRFETSWTSWTSWWGKFLTPTTPLRSKNRHCSRKQTSFCMIYWQGLLSMETLLILLRCFAICHLNLSLFFFLFFSLKLLCGRESAVNASGERSSGAADKCPVLCQDQVSAELQSSSGKFLCFLVGVTNNVVLKKNCPQDKFFWQRWFRVSRSSYLDASWRNCRTILDDSHYSENDAASSFVKKNTTYFYSNTAFKIRMDNSLFFTWS